MSESTPQPPIPTTPKTISTAQSRSRAGLAILIAGNLAAQGVIVIDLARPDWINHFDIAVRVIYAALQLQLSELEMPDVPIEPTYTTHCCE